MTDDLPEWIKWSEKHGRYITKNKDGLFEE